MQPIITLENIMLKINSYRKLWQIGSLLLLLGVAACHMPPKDSGLDVVIGKGLGKDKQLVKDKQKGLELEFWGSRTALHLAIEEDKSLASIDILLRNGAKINARDQYGLTPLHYAAKNSKNLEVIELLLIYGANIKARTKSGMTVLHEAANNNKNPIVIELLLDKGANAKARDRAGQTAADYAKYNKSIIGTNAYWRLNGAIK